MSKRKWRIPFTMKATLQCYVEADTLEEALKKGKWPEPKEFKRTVPDMLSAKIDEEMLEGLYPEEELEAIPDYGTLMSIVEFIDCCKSGGFINYDGSGNYSDGKQMSNIDVYPSDIMNGNVDERWSHVVWFNR